MATNCTQHILCLPSVLWRCWLGGRKDIWCVKNWVVGCWHGYLSGARCRLAHAQLMLLPLTVSCFCKIQIGCTFLVPAHVGSPGLRAVKRGHMSYLISPPALCELLVRRAYVLLLFYVFKNILTIFSDFCRTNYLSIYQTDLREICRIGRTLAADDRFEVVFSIPQGTLPWRPVL